MDYNRAGTPLIELVTEPDLRTPEEARLFMQKLRQIYLAIAVPRTNDLLVVIAGWPLTWVVCAIGMFCYYKKANWLPKEAE